LIKNINCDCRNPVNVSVKNIAVCRAALWPSHRIVLPQRLTIFSSEYYHVLIATHFPTPEGWKAEFA